MSVVYRGIPQDQTAVSKLPSDIVNQYYATGNDTQTNLLTVPSGYQYMLVNLLLAGGGAGGGGSGGHGTTQNIGGGSGAYIQYFWVAVNPGDVIKFDIGIGGTGQGPDYSYINTNNFANPGGDSTISIQNSGTNTFIPLITMGGGQGGCGSSCTDLDQTLVGTRGTPKLSRDTLGVNGNNADWNITLLHPVATTNQGGKNKGANSPWGAGGNNGSANGLSADGYGAGGGSAYFVSTGDLKTSTGENIGGNGSPGIATVTLTAYAPKDNTYVYNVNNTTSFAMKNTSYAPRLVGKILAKDLYDVQTFFNNNYPDLAFSYQPGVLPGKVVTASDLNNFINALASCNTGWDGSYACPDKTFYNIGEKIKEVQFKMPKPNFIPVKGREYYYSGNGTQTNVFIVPAGCRYMNLYWIIGAGGNGGGASGWSPTPGVNAMGGGSAAWAKDTWVEVKVGDIITFQVGNPGGNKTSKISIYRTGLNQTFTIFEVTGGGDGCDNFNTGAPYISTSQGGVVNAALGVNYSIGNHAPWNRGSGYDTGHVDGGQPGADSPLGKGGHGNGACKDCSGCCPASGGTGYGAGGGSGGYFDDDNP